MNFKVKKSILFPVALLLFSVVYAQTKDERSETQIQVDVSVWSSKKGYLKDLTEKDFEVYYDDEPQKIELSAPEDKPLTVGILFDISASMKTDRKKFSRTSIAADGFRAFLKNDNPDNEYFFITFGKEKSVSLDLTRDRDQIQKALDEIVKLDPKDPNTLLFDALKLGYEKFSSAKHSKKVLFLVSDGMDNDSEEKFKQIKKLFVKENIPIYFIKVITRQDLAGQINVFFEFSRIPLLERTPAYMNSVRNTLPLRSPDDLADLSYYTGGRLFFPVDSKEAAQVFEVIAEELKTQYSLRFTAKNPNKTEERRKLEIKLVMPKEKKKDLGKIRVNSRQEYFYKSP